MRTETEDWVRFAEADFKAAAALSRSRAKNISNIIGFHCQQCVEKYLKARLEEEHLPVPKVHSLTALLGLVLPKEPLWASFTPSLLLLNNYAVKFRYPGHLATRADARAALKACRSIRAEIRQSLGLPKK
jgi:HEPN domain-containing protein